MRRLHLSPGRHLPEQAEPHDLYGFARTPRATGRAQVELCMVSTVDGVIALDGRSGPLGSPTDRGVLASLRSAASWVLVGAETARAEQYNAPRRPDLRVGVVTRSANLDLSAPLFTSGSGVLVMPIDGPNVTVETIRAGVGDVDLVDAIMQMGGDFIHVEGGAHLNAQLLAADLVDAINITFSPTLGGGHGTSLTTPYEAQPQFKKFALAHVYEDEGYLFVRYERN